MAELELTLRSFSALQTIALTVVFFFGMIVFTITLSENNLKWCFLAIVCIAAPIGVALFQFA